MIDEFWIATGRTVYTGHYFVCRTLNPEDAKNEVKWRGVAAVIYKVKDDRKKDSVPEEERVAYLTLQDVKRLLLHMEPLAGPADAPLPPPISGPERESWKVQEGPNV